MHRELWLSPLLGNIYISCIRIFILATNQLPNIECDEFTYTSKSLYLITLRLITPIIIYFLFRILEIHSSFFFFFIYLILNFNYYILTLFIACIRTRKRYLSLKRHLHRGIIMSICVNGERKKRIARVQIIDSNL